MKYWEDGFYLEQNKDGTRLEISDDEWQELLGKHSNGEIIYLDNNQLKTKKIEITEEELKQRRIYEIKSRLTELNYDLVQDFVGEIIEDIEQRKQEFISLHNELRELLGKEKRKIKEE